MAYSGKLLRFCLWSLIALTGLAVVLYFMVPHLINSRPVKARLLAQIQTLVDGDVTFDTVELFLWPSPHAIVKQGRLQWGPLVALDLEALVVHPRIPALLRGHLEVAAATLIALRAVIRLDGDTPESAPTVPMGALFGDLASIMAPNGSLRLENGQMDFLGPEGPLLRLDNLDMAADAEGVTVTARGQADGIDGLRMTVNLPWPGRIDTPHDAARAGEGPAPFALTIQADRSDVARLARLASVGDPSRLPPAVTRVLREGTIEGFALHTSGMSLARLSDFSAMHITGTLSDGAIHVPGIMLDLDAVSGNVSIVQGTLTADSVAARLGATTGRRGTLTMGLLDTPLTMDLAMELDADLAQLPAVLRQIVDHPRVHAELDGIRNLAGRAVGHLYLNGRVTDLAVKAVAQAFQMDARHDRLPDRLRIHQGKLHYTDRQVRIEAAKGEIRNSTFENLTVDLSWSDAPWIDLASVAARIDAEAAFAWTAPLMATRTDAETLQTVTGWLVLSDGRISGPLLDPRQWQVDATGCLENLTLVGGQLPGPLRIEEGCIHIQENHLRLSKVRLDLGDAHLHGTATVPLRDAAKASFSLGGTVGPEMVVWLQDAFQVPVPMALAGPITALEMDITHRQRKAAIHVEARFDLSDQLSLAATLEIDDGRLRLEELSVSDRTSDARLTGMAAWADNQLEWDLALTSEVLDVNTIPSIFRASNGKAPPEPETSRERTFGAMAGRITISIGSLIHGDHRLEAIKGTFRVDGDRATLAVTEADLCGVSTVGQLDWHPGGVSLRLRPKAQDQALRYTAGCFSGASSTERLEGTLAVEGALTADGGGIEALRAALRGEVELGVTDGRVYNIGEAGLLTNILSFLKINNLVRGDLPNMRERDFKYDRMHLRARVEGSKVAIEEAELISDALNMVGEGHVDLKSGQLDLTLLVSPLTTVDAIIRHIPIVGRILQGTLVAIPVGVRGPLSNPRVLPLAPRAVGARLVGILERTLQTPFHVIGPILPQGNDRHNGENQPRSSD